MAQRRFALSSIRWRAALLTSALVTAVLAVFVAYAVRQVAADVVRRANDRSDSAALLLAAQSSQSVQQNLRRLQDVGRDPAIRTLLDAPDTAPRPAAIARLEQVASGTGDQTIELWDPHGRRLVTAAIPKTASAVLPPAPTPTQAGLDPLQRQGPMVFSRATVALTVSNERDPVTPTVVGYLVSSHTVSVGSSALISALVGEGARVFFGNSGGDVWTDLDRPLPPPAVDVRTPGARQFAGEDGQTLIGSPVAIAGTPWVLLVAFPRAVIMAPVWHLLWQLIGAGLIFTLTATAVAAAFSRRVTTPLVELTGAAQAIAGGNYASRVRARGRDELGELADAFNAMAHKIEQVRAELEARAKELDASREEARQANQAKDDFLAVLSHELRTPLNAVLGWCHILRTMAVSPDRIAHAMAVIERNARTQLRLVEDLLDVSRIVAGKFTVDLHPIDPAGVVRSAVESIQPSAAAKDVAVHIHLASGIGLVDGDAGRLNQAVGNLLSNALKFTPSGGRIDVVLTRAADTTEIVVRDNGDGIEADALPVIFQRLHQAEGHPARRHSGLGLGLAIVRQVIELHGGAVRAESGGKGMGSAFRLFLPAIPAHAQADAPAIVPDDASGEAAKFLRGLECLVVEDSTDARELIAYVLTAGGAHVTAVPGTREALDSLRRRVPDLLISDLEMPGQSGFELIARIRSWPAERGGAMPAIAVTAHAAPEDRERSRGAGFDAHVAKPVDERELVAVVSRLIVSRRSAEPAIGQRSSVTSPVS